MAAPVVAAKAAATAGRALAFALNRARRRRRGRGVLGRLVQAIFALLGLFLFLLLFVFLPVGVVASLNPFGGGGPPAGIPAVHWPMYTAAAREYNVNPYLLASIHEKESNFGRLKAAGVKSGANSCGAGGPMQIGIVGVSPYHAFPAGCNAGSTWRGHWNASRPIEDSRPSAYPLQRSALKSCRPVPSNVGCVYDSFDAIAGAAHLLKAEGANASLGSKGTYGAVFQYNHDHGYVREVLDQARKWEAEGATQSSISLGAAVDGTPPRSLPRIQAVASAIDGMTERGQIPYCWGGGHGPRPGPDGGDYCWHGNRKVWGSDASGLDCSGAVRLLLTESGFPDPGGMASGSYGGYLDSGQGGDFTIYYSGGAFGHIYAVIGGRTWQTSTTNRNHGPGWTSPRSSAGFAVGHVEALQ